MGRVAYYIKDVRENTNTHGVTTTDVVDPTYLGNRNFSGENVYKLYEWPEDLDETTDTAATQGALAYARLIQDPNIVTAIDRSANHTRNGVLAELTDVYDEATVEDAAEGNELRLRVGKRIYIFGYAYSATGAVPDNATITWKE